MQTMPSTSQPMNPPPSGGANHPAAAERGLAQLVVTTLLVVLAFSAGWFGNGYVNRDNYIPPNDVNQHVLNEAWDTINNNYVFTQNIDKQKMAYAAISAMVQTLNDPGHTRFETPEEFKNEASSLNNQGTVGIGVEVSGGGQDPITIVAVFPDTPASKGGLRAGDQIVAVDGKDVRGMTLDQVTPLIRGPEGTTVAITVLRPTPPPPTSTAPSATPTPPTATPSPTPSPTPGQSITVTLTRQKYTPKTALSFIIPQVNIADIQLVDFSQDADSELQTAIKDALAQHVSGIILDLRGNGGGYLDQAVNVTSEFVPAGQNKNVLIVRSRTSRQTYPVKPGGLATNVPLAILIDHDTASAAEITAGAIAINRPDVHTVGQTTFGTGTVLLPFTLSDGSVLDLGTSEWLLPDGSSVYHKGLAPEQPVALPQGLVPLTALSAPGNQASYEYIQKYGDTQLLQAIKDLAPQAGG